MVWEGTAGITGCPPIPFLHSILDYEPSMHISNNDTSSRARPSRCVTLGGPRKQIDDVDDSIIELISSRLELARRAAAAKHAQGAPARDLQREAEIVRRAATNARQRSIEPEPVRNVFWSLLALSHLDREADRARAARRDP